MILAATNGWPDAVGFSVLVIVVGFAWCVMRTGRWPWQKGD
jgi:hypothetical protein